MIACWRFFLFYDRKNDILYYVTKFAVQNFNQVGPIHLAVNVAVELFITVIHTKNLKILWHIIFLETKKQNFFKNAQYLFQLFVYIFYYQLLIFILKLLDSTYRYCRLITIFFLTTTTLLLSPYCQIRNFLLFILFHTILVHA